MRVVGGLMGVAGGLRVAGGLKGGHRWSQGEGSGMASGINGGLRGVKRGGLRRVTSGLSGSQVASGGTGRVWVSAGRVWVTTGWVWGIAGKVWVMVETASRLKLGPFSSSFQALSRPHQFFENPW